MADRIRQIQQLAQKLKEKVHLTKINVKSREKVDQFITKYAPAAKVSEIAEKFKHGSITQKVQELITRYEKFTGVEEIMAIQHTVVEAQDKFMSAQEQRRDLGRQLANIEARLKELHAEMQNTMKGDEKYLQLCTEEHKLIIQERALRTLFADAEREERELFATMSAAVKLGHERERAHAERNKYWYIVASIFGTVLGIAGSTVNNRLKMAEFRDMMEQQMARSASVLYTIAGGGTASRADITDAMKTEFAYQEQLAQNLKSMQENINHLVSKQSSLIDLEVTGISRSGRVRKKSSKLMDFESPDDIEARFRRQTPVKSYANFRQEERQEIQDFAIPESQRPVEEVGTASGSESDYYENNGDNADSMESDSSASDDGGTPRQHTPANSLYMMEKNTKKKLIVKDGRVIGRAKAQRKDKGKTRITAYMMWAKEARNDLLRKHPDMDFSAISKRLGEMWSNVNYNERYLWKRKAKRFAIQKEQSNQAGVNKIISNPSIRPLGHAGPGRPPANRPPKPHQVTPPSQALVPVAAGGATPRAGCGAVDVAAHLRLLGESLAIIGERLKEHEGQIAVSGSVSVLLDTLLCSLAPLLGVTRAIPAIAPPARLLADTLHNIAYIMPGL